MKIPCPNCGATFSLDAVLKTSDAGKAFLSAFDVPPELKESVIKYLGLFRSTKQLSFKRTTTLLDTLTPVIKAGEVTYKHVTKPAPIEAWKWAIDEMLEQHRIGELVIPLKNHNYLYAVVQSYKLEPSSVVMDHKYEQVQEEYQPVLPAPADGSFDGKVLLNGSWKICFPNMNTKETHDYVMQNRNAGETSDEAYDRLAKDIYSDKPEA